MRRANSWLDAAGVLGFELRLACPKGYEPNGEILERNRKKTKVTLGDDPREVNPHSERKSIGCENTFAEDLKDLETIRREVGRRRVGRGRGTHGLQEVRLA